MINFSKYDVIVVKFPFASSLKYKARPAVVISSGFYNDTKREALIIMAISSQVDRCLDYEEEIVFWRESGLLKPSVFKASVATIEQASVLTKLGTLQQQDIQNLQSMLQKIC